MLIHIEMTPKEQ